MSHDGKPPETETQPPASRRRPTRVRRLELKLLRKMGLLDDGDTDFDCPICRQEALDRAKNQDDDEWS